MEETLAEHALATTGMVGQPLYQQIAANLRSRIKSHEFAAGSYLPTEEKLCAHYRVSRFTIREALRQLQVEGLIARRRGAGTLIQHDSTNAEADAPEPAGADGAEQLAPGRFGGATTLIADERLARRLGCAPGSRWLVKSAVYAAACGTPTGLVEFYLAPPLKAVAEQIRPGPEPVWQQMRQLEQPLGQIHMKIQSVTPVQTEARLLNVAALAPCLRITYICHDPEGEMLAIATHLHPGHSFTYETALEP